MQIAAGRLRVLGSFSLSVRLEPNREKLHAKARAHAERALTDRYPPRTVQRFDSVKVIPQDFWRNNGRFESRTATLLAEREGVLRALDGAGRWGSGARVPRWRLHKRRMLTLELCRRNRIDKWW